MLNFDQEGYDKFKPMGFNVRDLKKTMDHWIKALHGVGYCALFLGNHDQCRPLSRFGNTGIYRERSAKTLANAMYFLEGVPYIYQGEELGMTNTVFTSIEEFNDVEVFNYWKQHVELDGEDPDTVLKLLNMRSRDTSRSPMPWDDSDFGGFSKVRPWLAVSSEYKEVNVEKQDKDPASVLNFYRQLIKVRHGLKSVIKGDLLWIDFESNEHMSYIRKYEDEILLSLNNFTEHKVEVKIPEEYFGDSTILLTNADRKKLEEKTVILEPWECLTCVIK